MNKETTSHPVRHIRIGPEQEGQKILVFLESLFQGQVPRSAIQRLIRTGQVRLDGGRVKPFDRVRAGQNLRVPPVKMQAASTQDPVGRVPILHADADLFVIDKPRGIPVHPGSGWNDSIIGRLRSMFPDDSFAPVPVHRLDRDTSGLLLVARSFSFLRHMQTLWQEHLVGKHYLCWCRNASALQGTAILEDRLRLTGGPGKEKMASGQGQVCQMTATVLRTTPRNHGLILVRLLTGRKHQIRAQLGLRDHPIVGDAKYGDRPWPHGLLLHSCCLVWENRAFISRPPWPEPWQVTSEDWTLAMKIAHPISAGQHP
ncbi:MAG: RluA family pseudouridine synthase [Deltaproteobacteria bacterium]|nr:RluA family pseudouridine synthase [Deltaproteobacteria bacterium]